VAAASHCSAAVAAVALACHSAEREQSFEAAFAGYPDLLVLVAAAAAAAGH